jgi:F-type H+-transporting ATPase subunit delta
MQTISRRRLATYVSSELAGGKAVKPLLKQVASYLVEHKQTNQVSLLIRDIEAILARDHGVVLTEVISARELSKGLINNIEQFVARAVSAKQVEVNTSVDPSLLGGVIIRTPRAELDTTVRKKLNALRSN